ncbi:hypothetical protein [Myxococcus qinghaiensis]|uniref:hypothetical protein n=1 Tax=Myxococcus qinghaiensis TaxID=2906758 RepID=UPI0020A80C7E|nr:hypothetical protein [Myxococcus qinghaiensis]MCP3161807.1 hypothetical protein [Myxococcus qinghaiensis]
MHSLAITVNTIKINEIANLLRNTAIAGEEESGEHRFQWTKNSETLANAYLAIVAICHQTSPLGERRLEGHIHNQPKYGWDYLKEKFLLSALDDARWHTPSGWQLITPADLSMLFSDSTSGLTLNRINERAYLLNNLGDQLSTIGLDSITQLFEDCGRHLAGDNGLFAVLRRTDAYRDPAAKKAQFFLSIAIQECGWHPVDQISLASPVDYHELRGHLRIGTVEISDTSLRAKIERGLTLSEEEDSALRLAVQDANGRIASATRTTTSSLHYLLWNTFRNCCPRGSLATHCQACPPSCNLPSRYKEAKPDPQKCIFSSHCDSANKISKPNEPPYMGHYY